MDFFSSITPAEWIAVVTAASAFVFPQIQIISLRHQLALGRFHEEVAVATRVGDIFLQSPECRPYFYNCQDLTENDPNADKVKVIAEALCDAFAYMVLSWKRSTNIPHTRAGQERWIQDIYRSSPALRRWIARHEDWYPKDMIRFLEKRCGYVRGSYPDHD